MTIILSTALNNITAPDAYKSTSTIDIGQFLDHVNIDAVNQGIFWQLKQILRPGDGITLADWGTEVYMAPGSRTIDRTGIAGIRVRAAIPAAQLPANTSQAQVTVEAIHA